MNAFIKWTNCITPQTALCEIPRTLTSAPAPDMSEMEKLVLLNWCLVICDRISSVEVDLGANYLLDQTHRNGKELAQLVPDMRNKYVYSIWMFADAVQWNALHGVLLCTKPPYHPIYTRRLINGNLMLLKQNQSFSSILTRKIILSFVPRGKWKEPFVQHSEQRRESIFFTSDWQRAPFYLLSVFFVSSRNVTICSDTFHIE